MLTWLAAAWMSLWVTSSRRRLIALSSILSIVSLIIASVTKFDLIDV